MGVVPEGEGEFPEGHELGVMEGAVGPGFCGGADGGESIGLGFPHIGVRGVIGGGWGAPDGGGIEAGGAEVEEEDGFIWHGYGDALGELDVEALAADGEEEGGAIREGEAGVGGEPCGGGWGR